MKFSIECSNVDHTLINCVGISAGLTKKKPIQKKQGNLYTGEEKEEVQLLFSFRLLENKIKRFSKQPITH